MAISRVPKDGRRVRRIAGMGLLAVSALAAGCGGSSTSTSAPSATPTTQATAPATTTGATPATAPAAAGTKSCPRVPANPDQAAEFGLTDCEVERRQVKVESLIQVCMKGQGFDYVPVDPATLRLATDGGQPGGVGEKDFPKLYGYGIATLYATSLQNAAKVRGQPNEKIRSSLKPADAAAYDRALYGSNPGATFAAALGKEDPTGLGGCTKQAFDAVFPPSEVAQLRKISQDAVTQAAAQDARVIAAAKVWSGCMRAAGLNYGTPEEAKADIKKKLALVVGQAGAAGSTSAAPFNKAAVDALGREEINVAVADSACQAKGYSATVTKVEAEVAKKLGR
jgi:hypothetical protein